MTMVPSPKLTKPLHFFYGGCGGGGGASGVMTRFSDGCTAGSGGYGGGGYNNITTSSANNIIIAPNGQINNNIVMGEEQHSRNSNTSINDDDGDQLPVAAAAASDNTPNTPPDHHHHHDSSSNWLQLGLGGTTQSSFEQQHPTRVSEATAAQVMQMGGGGGGLMLELNLGGDGGGMIHQTSPELESRVPQRGLDFGSPTFYGGVGSSATVFLTSPHHHHHPIFPLIPPNPNLNPNPLILSEDHQIGWGFRNQRAAAAGGAGCSSSLSPSSSSSMPPGQGSFLTRPFTPSGSSVDSEFRLIHPPPRRHHSGIWFTLQASLHQSKEPFLPQVSKSFLRIKDGRMTIRLVMKYVANKLGLDSESEVEIRCRGQQLVPFLTLQHVRDNIWSPREAAVTLLPDSSTSHHLMVLNYGRISSTST